MLCGVSGSLKCQFQQISNRAPRPRHNRPWKPIPPYHPTRPPAPLLFFQRQARLSHSRTLSARIPILFPSNRRLRRLVSRYGNAVNRLGRARQFLRAPLQRRSALLQTRRWKQHHAGQKRERVFSRHSGNGTLNGFYAGWPINRTGKQGFQAAWNRMGTHSPYKIGKLLPSPRWRKNESKYQKLRNNKANPFSAWNPCCPKKTLKFLINRNLRELYISSFFY